VDNQHRLLFLDPGHFHAALTLRVPHARVDDAIAVYAHDGPELRDFLALVERFNGRAEAPTQWRVDVVTTPEPLARLIADRRGDVVVLAGKNAGKAATMHRLHDAGFHVLADKPWLVQPDDLSHVRASLAGWPLAAEIMTGRHDVAARLLKRIVDVSEVFGNFRPGGAGIESRSVHHLEKHVDGARGCAGRGGTSMSTFRAAASSTSRPTSSTSRSGSRRAPHLARRPSSFARACGRLACRSTAFAA
jgi:hypothetical protein